MCKLRAYLGILFSIFIVFATLLRCEGKPKRIRVRKKDNNLINSIDTSLSVTDESLIMLQQNNSLQNIENNKSNIHGDSERLHKLLKLVKRREDFAKQNEAIEMQRTVSSVELECKFGNFSDFLSVLQPDQRLYTCEAFNLRVLSNNTRVGSVSGMHTLNNENVVVFRNIFTKSPYIPNGIAQAFPNLLHFYFVSSRVRHIFRRNFQGFGILVTLDLRHNEIESIQSNTFLDLFNLEVLSLSGNFLKSLPQNAFVSMLNLKYFDASNNKLSLFNDEIFASNSALQEMLLDFNEIQSIKSNFERFSDIGFIDLRGNVCADKFYVRDHPDCPLLFEFQGEIDYNCTKPEKSAQSRGIIDFDLCRYLEPGKRIKACQSDN